MRTNTAKTPTRYIPRRGRSHKSNLWFCKTSMQSLNCGKRLIGVWLITRSWHPDISLMTFYQDFVTVKFQPVIVDLEQQTGGQLIGVGDGMGESVGAKPEAFSRKRPPHRIRLLRRSYAMDRKPSRSIT